MSPPFDNGPAACRDELLARYRHLTTKLLPARAAREGWPVRADHCFQRIVLDHAVGAAWKTVLAGRGPAWQQLDDAQLSAAVRIAQSIDAEGVNMLQRLNAQSLMWRGKKQRSVGP